MPAITQPKPVQQTMSVGGGEALGMRDEQPVSLLGLRVFGRWGRGFWDGG